LRTNVSHVIDELLNDSFLGDFHRSDALEHIIAAAQAIDIHIKRDPALYISSKECFRDLHRLRALVDKAIETLT